MATASLKNKTKAAKDAAPQVASTTEAPAANADTTLATTPDRTLATGGRQQHEDFVGAWDRSDERLPRINLIHKTSKSDMITKFGIGSFVFNREVKLSDGIKPVVVTALLVAKDFSQKLPFDSVDQPVVFKTPDEVRNNGGTLDYSKEAVAEQTFFQPRAHIQLVTEMPADVEEEQAALFPYEFAGKQYGMAILTVSSSAYTSVGKELATLRDQNKVMRNGLRFGSLELTQVERPHPKNPWLVPVIRYAGANPADLVKFFEGLMK